MAHITLRDYLQETEDAISSGRTDEAFANCHNILAHFPESLEAQRLLGEICLAQSNLEEAQHALDWVLTNDPENVVAYCDRALISERISDYDTALDCYQQAYELSRSNAQIRQEFNHLSAKVGQQGFMFSRAGLARLYMRGDLLPQAIQEWETVLATTPDRLDARVGLLEACWREGLHDRVEQLASQILQEIPGCLKALLLLAYVTAPRNMPYAQELLRGAEALDPDLVMAQELFSDMLADQPGDPFLRLLKRPLVSLDTSHAHISDMATSESPIPSASSADRIAALSNISSPPSSNDFYSDPPSHWSGNESWDHDASLISPFPDASSQQNRSALPIWNLDNFADSGSNKTTSHPLDAPDPDLMEPVLFSNNEMASAEPWSPFDQTAELPKQNASDLQPWQLLEDSLNNFSSIHQPLAEQEQPSWANMGSMAGSGIEGIDKQETTENMMPSDLATLWSMPSKGDMASAPSWLDMLTPAEQKQMSEPSLPVPQLPPAEPTPTPASQREEVAPTSSPIWNPEPVNPLNEDSEEEAFSFGPEWLKSLGAAELDAAEEEPEPIAAAFASPTVTPFTEPESQPKQAETPWRAPLPETANETWSVHVSESQSKIIHESLPIQKPETSDQPEEELWGSPLSLPQSTPVYIPQVAELPEPQPVSASPTWQEQIADINERIEHNLVTTLEGLEQNLRSKGFVHLEPKSLSTIAHNQEPATASSNEPVPITTPQAQEVYQEPSLSSALAELGNYAQPSSPIDEPAPPERRPVTPPEESSWATSLRSVPGTYQPPIPATPVLNDTPAEFVKNVTPAAMPEPVMKAPQELSFSPPRVEAKSGPVFESAPVASFTGETVKAPLVRANPFLDNELETTMRRPAVRLQSVPQRQTTPLSGSKGRSGERPHTSNTADNNLSYQERLVKGYQSQLTGAYDDAMQEYRIIIRGAPELLGEVVSNVRALLKLAPRYSTGYRVLGDAYMRQGEYLQAMEAYNKALTMAKRARA